MNYKEVQELVNNFKTEHEMGLNPSEQAELITMLPESVTWESLGAAMGINTCMVNERGEIVSYHCDIITGIMCVIENREKRLYEWD